MTRFLLATQPITGHVLPALPIAQTLVERGHEVHWYTGAKFRSKVEATGAVFEPFRAAYDYDDSDFDAAFPGRGALSGVNQMKFDLVHVFVKQLAPQHRDLEVILAEFPADVILADFSTAAAASVHERGGPPFAILGATTLSIRSRDTAPFGLGMLPDGSPLGRLRNRLLYAFAARTVFGGASAEAARQLASLGLPPVRVEGVILSPYLHLQATVPGFEYLRSDLPAQVHFIGALLPDAPNGFTPPAWWPEVTRNERPVVLVTQGTAATNEEDLIVPALKALAGEDVFVIAAGVKSNGSLGINPLPSNARVEAFLPFKHVMPHVDVYVTNGGFGGIQYALVNGVPVVTGGTTEDKPETNARIAYSGAGINLKTANPTPDQVRDAVRRVLGDPQYRQAAQKLKAEFSKHDAPAEAAVLLERLAETKQPVVDPLCMEERIREDGVRTLAWSPC